MKKFVLFLFLILLLCTQPASGVDTHITVTARAKDAKFIGTSMGGALVVIRDSITGEIMVKGLIAGDTGDTKIMMQTPLKRGALLSTPTSAKFQTAVDLDEPRLVTVEVHAPLGQKQSLIKASTQVWLIPGKDMAGSGDGILIEVPGFAVDVLAPQPHAKYSLESGKAHITIRANVVMMCGCPVEPGGIWDAAAYEVSALIKRNGKPLEGIPLRYAGTTSLFEGTVDLTETGAYEITVYAYAARTGNTGLDTTTVVVQ